MLYSAPIQHNQISAVMTPDRIGLDALRAIPSANILVIDPDIRGMRECIQAFGERGWHVEVAECFVDALRLLEGPLYDLVLIEISLPDMLGTEAWTFIRKMNPRVSAIMTTSSRSLHQAINALGQGASAYLLKPLDTQLLCNLIQQMLELRSAKSEIKQLRTRLVGLHNLFSALTCATSPDQIYDKTLAHLRAIVHYDLALMYGTSPRSTDLVRVGSHSTLLLPTTLNESQSEFVEAAARECIETLQPIVLTRSYPDKLDKWELPEDFDLKSCALVPLIGQRSVYGVLATLSSHLIEPSQEPIQLEILVALAQVMAMALDKVSISEKLASLEQSRPPNGE